MRFLQKRVFTFSILLMFIYPFDRSICQSYNSLLSENKTWDIYYWEAGNIVFYQRGNRQYVSGDTIINGQNYKIVWANSIISDEQVFVEPYYLDKKSYQWGFIREDSNSKKIYTWSIDQNKEFLTYDFGMEIGDSLHLEYLDGHYRTLESITKVTLNTGEERNQFNFSDPWAYESNKSYIEGIGGESSLLYPFDYSFEFGADLNCVKEGSQIIYNLSNCDLLTKNKESNIHQPFLIYPNPTTSTINIEFGERNINSIQILNLHGLEILREDEYNLKSFNLDILPSGVYFIKIRFDADQYYIEKLVKS